MLAERKYLFRGGYSEAADRYEWPGNKAVKGLGDWAHRAGTYAENFAVAYKKKWIARCD
jgi:hypothetical protein